MKVTTRIFNEKVTVETTNQKGFFNINGKREYSSSFRCAVLEGMLKGVFKRLGA